MKNNDSEKKFGVTSILHKAADIGKKGVCEVKKGVGNVVEQSKINSEKKRFEKLNPLFPDVYQSKDFNIPSMIVIVDGALRKNEKLCEGAIGWTNKDSGIEVMFLYDEVVSFSGLQFVPMATRDAVYYVDNFDKNRYIRIDCIFGKAHEEKIAELKHIARSLGAKRCFVELSEENYDVQKSSKSVSANANVFGVSAGGGEFLERKREKGEMRSGRSLIDFGENTLRIHPELKWFKHDDNIKCLIDMRLGDGEPIKSERFELACSSFATMSQATACSIDGAICKIGLKCKVSMSEESQKELRSKLIFEVEF